MVETSGSGAEWKEVRVWEVALKGIWRPCPCLSLFLGCCEVSNLPITGFPVLTKPQGNGARSWWPETLEALSQKSNSPPFQLIASGVSSQGWGLTQHTADCQHHQVLEKGGSGPGLWGGGSGHMSPFEFQEETGLADTLTLEP